MGKSELPSGKHTKNYGKEKPPLFNYLEVRQIKELSTGPFSSSQTLSLPGRGSLEVGLMIYESAKMVELVNSCDCWVYGRYL
jgi:hypothetical protein